MVALLAISFTCFAPPTEEVDLSEHMLKFDIEHRDFTVENLVLYLKLLDSTNYKVIMKQAILETRHFKSKLFKGHNNLFGMKYANKRPNNIKGKAYGHASFEHWTDSVEDYFMWRTYMVNKKHLQTTDYYTFLKKVGYAADPSYIQILKKIKVLS